MWGERDDVHTHKCLLYVYAHPNSQCEWFDMYCIWLHETCSLCRYCMPSIRVCIHVCVSYVYDVCMYVCWAIGLMCMYAFTPRMWLTRFSKHIHTNKVLALAVSACLYIFRLPYWKRQQYFIVYTYNYHMYYTLYIYVTIYNYCLCWHVLHTNIHCLNTLVSSLCVFIIQLTHIK